MIGGMLAKGLVKPEEIIGSAKTSATMEKIKSLSASSAVSRLSPFPSFPIKNAVPSRCSVSSAGDPGKYPGSGQSGNHHQNGRGTLSMKLFHYLGKTFRIEKGNPEYGAHSSPDCLGIEQNRGEAAAWRLE